MVFVAVASACLSSASVGGGGARGILESKAGSAVVKGLIHTSAEHFGDVVELFGG